MAEKKKVYWAFDPYSDEKESWKKAVIALKAFREKVDCDIFPVYFINEQNLNWYGHAVPQKLDPLLDILKEVMVSCLNEFSDLQMEAPEVIFSKTTTKRGLARFVADFFEERKADLVCLSTHARKGLKKAFFGSFTESLLWHCPVPQLLVSPNSQPKEKIKHVFYPTTLNDEGIQFFRNFLELGYAKGATLDIYSKMVAPSETFAKTMTTVLGGGWMTLAEFDVKESKRLEEKVADWREIAKNAGIEARSFIDGTEGQLTDRILEVSQEMEADLIIMPSFISKLDAVLVGSQTLEVIRNSSVPVLVQHFKA